MSDSDFAITSGATHTEEQPRLTLFAIEAQMQELMEWRDSCETDEDRLAAEKALGDYVQLEIEKVDGVRGYILHAQAKAAECDTLAGIAQAEADRQKARREAWQGRADRLKQLCLNILTMTGKTKLEGRTGSLSLRKNGGKTPLVIEDDLMIPARFCDVIKVPRKEEIRVALEGGQDVPGAKFGERGVHLSVK